MAKENNVILVVALVILALVFYKYSGAFEIVGELGWIPLTYTNTQITGFNGPVMVTGGETYSSKFWNASFSDYMNYRADRATFTGGDGQISIACSLVSSSSDSSYGRGGCGGVSIQFNQDMKGKYFAFDYIDGTTHGVIEYIPSIINPDESVRYVNGLKSSVINTSNGFYPSYTPQVVAGSGIDLQTESRSATLSNPRYKPAFDCAMDNDEVLIFDEFTAGSTVGISNLTYPVQKFCINQPVVIRSFTNRGIGVDSSNEILLQLSEGKTFTVAPDTTMRVPYITKIQTGLLRCSASQAFNTQNNSCENILGTGTNNEPVGTQVIAVNIGDNQVSYSQNYQSSVLNIGDININPTKPSYTCSCTEDTLRTVSANPKNCFNTQINGNTLLYGNNYKINDYLNLDFINIEGVLYNNAQYHCEFPNDVWKSTFLLNVDKSGLDISTSDTLSTINANKKVRISLDNKIANFDSAGVIIRTKRNLIDYFSDTRQTFSLNKGVSTKDIPLVIDTLGYVNMEVIPFVTIMGKDIYSNKILFVNYMVGSDGSISLINNTTLIQTLYQNITQTVYSNQTCLNGLTCPSGFTCNSDGTCSQTITVQPSLWERFGLSGLIALVLGSVILWLVVRGKR